MNQNYPIAIMSFNRPHYLEPVLKALSEQVDCRISKRPIFLFQDGAVNLISRKTHADQKDIDVCVDIFRHYLPHGMVFKSDENLGVALNFERAEDHIFNELGADAAIFFEDDLLVSPFYVHSLEQLLEIARADDRIGYVAVYGHHKTSLRSQRENPNKFILLEHNWGFGLTKRQWFRNNTYVGPYLDLVRQYDYRSRDANRIHELFATWGLGCPGDSQDVAKTLACCLTGAVKLNIQACLGKYIGAAGLHMKQDSYERLGYEATEIFAGPVTDFGELSSTTYNEIFDIQMRWATEKPCKCSRHPTIQSRPNNTDIGQTTGTELDAAALGGAVKAAFIILTGAPPPPSFLERFNTATGPLDIRTLLLRDPQLSAQLPELRLAYQIRMVRAARASGIIRLIIGAAGTFFSGWVPTDQDLLDLLNPDTWRAWLEEASVSAMVAEHVWEHLDQEKGLIAACTCYRFLIPGKHIRIAVPDALKPDPEYHELCKVGGRDGQKFFYDYMSLTSLFQSAGFEVRPLEYWDENGEFHRSDWDSADGHIGRSLKFDPRNKHNKYAYTSLIVDAVKPLQ
jgi:predicted SAM-dependent methyltransferase